MVGRRTQTDEPSECWYGSPQHEVDDGSDWNRYGEPQHESERVFVPPSQFERQTATEILTVDPSTLDAFSRQSVEAVQHG